MTNTAQKPEDIPLMFVQTAAGLDDVGNILRRNVTPATSTSATGPWRVAGYVASVAGMTRPNWGRAALLY